MNKKSTCYNEAELVELLKKNNKTAFEYLYDHYAAGLYGIICRILRDGDKADDILQESFVKIWKNIGYYDQRKGTLFTWMLNVARNSAIDRLRADAKFESSIKWDAVLEDDLTPECVSDPFTTTIDLQAIVDRLVFERKQIIELVYFEGFTHEQVSEHLHLPLGTVKSRVRKALMELRQVFDIPPAHVQMI